MLLEDVPGLGKTLLARSLAKSLSCSFARIQFTPDLLPSDVTGLSVYNQQAQDFQFRAGPIFSQVVLADEINRATPRTQSALLEAMEEGRPRWTGKPARCPRRSWCWRPRTRSNWKAPSPCPKHSWTASWSGSALATCSKADEIAMLARRLDRKTERAELRQVVDAAELLAMRESLEQVEVSADLLDYVVSIVGATREHPQIQVGASPRGGLALVQLARGQALLRQRDYVIPDDVKSIAVPALAHRITLRPELWVRQVSARRRGRAAAGHRPRAAHRPDPARRRPAGQAGGAPSGPGGRRGPPGRLRRRPRVPGAAGACPGTPGGC